jgi:hypothetical protein
MRAIDVISFHDCFLSLNDRNAYIKERWEYKTFDKNNQPIISSH